MTYKHTAAAVLFLFTLVFSVGLIFQKEAHSFPTGDQKPPQSGTVSGTVIETMNASGYTYMNVDTGKEKLWVAIPRTEVKKDEKVTFYQGMVMPEFESDNLKRKFKNIIFSPGLAKQGDASPNQTAAADTKKAEDSGNSFTEAVKAEGGQTTPSNAEPVMSGGSAAASAAPVEVKVEKAEGENSYTINEIFGKAEDLNGQKVRVKGKVAKYNAGIMGKNWIHLQDGTGDPDAKTHDLVATTKETLDSTGDIITIEGVVTKDKDFGFGYKYVVIIEEATIIK